MGLLKEGPLVWTIPSIPCPCGRSHAVSVETLAIGENALDDLQRFLLDRNIRSVLVLDDGHTGPILGDLVQKTLSDAGIAVASLRYPASDHLRADHEALAAASQAIRVHHPVELVVSVGSGTLTDIARYASYLADLPFVAVATAPSVDGYASTVAALQFDGVKVTKPALAPIAIFALPSILAEAPWPMIQSGFGDLAGKISALMDWKLARTLYAESWCDAAYQVVSKSLARLFAAADGLAKRDPESVSILFRGLVHSGMAMAMMGNSRPASGSEHHLSHYWDFVTYQGRRPYIAHGLQVGYAAHFILDLYRELPYLGPLKSPVLPVFDDAWQAEIRMRWGIGANDILREQTAKLEWLRLRQTPDRFQGSDGGTIRQALAPEFEQIETTKRVLIQMGISHALGQFGVSTPILVESLNHAHEVRARYTILDFFRGQGRLGPWLDRVLERFPAS